MNQWECGRRSSIMEFRNAIIDMCIDEEENRDSLDDEGDDVDDNFVDDYYFDLLNALSRPSDTLRQLLVEAASDDLTDQDEPVIRRTICLESSILDDHLKHTLMRMIVGDSGGHVKGSLLLSHTLERTVDGSRDNSIVGRASISGGVSAASFNAAVRNEHGVFLVVLENWNGCIFGACVHDQYGATSSDPASSGHPGNFLFSLGTSGLSGVSDSSKSTSPLKLFASSSSQNFFTSSFGLHMGTDLVAFFSPGSSVCAPYKYCDVAPGYSLPPGESLQEGTLCGTPGTASYTACRTEIFSLIISPPE
jgi:hypothetical protein